MTLLWFPHGEGTQVCSGSSVLGLSSQAHKDPMHTGSTVCAEEGTSHFPQPEWKALVCFVAGYMGTDEWHILVATVW